MEGSALRFDTGEFDVVLLWHLRVYVSEIGRVLRKSGYFITQMMGNGVY